MKEIPLTHGKVALVDDGDYEYLMQFKWYPYQRKYTCYAQSTHGKHMSRVIMNPPSDRVVDHIDGNGLNNQRSNLRIVTHFENSQNRRSSPVPAGAAFKQCLAIDHSIIPPKNQMKLFSGKDPNTAWRLSLPKDGCRALGWIPGDTITVTVIGKTMRLVKVV